MTGIGIFYYICALYDLMYYDNAMKKRNLILCACASRSFMDKNRIAAAAAAIKQQGYAVTIEPDLCKSMMQASDKLKQDLAKSTVVACHPRALTALFDTLGLTPDNNQFIDLRDGSVEDVCRDLNIPATYDESDKAEFMNVINGFAAETGTDAWYPVIDKTRCIECGKCHDFCLFGVYAIVNNKVTVRQPGQCKNNCPACARMCPSKAIIFPKYEKSPINGGLADEEPALTMDTKEMYAEALRNRIAQRREKGLFIRTDKP